MRSAECQPDESQPSKRIRSALEKMLDAAETDGQLSSTDLDSHEQLVQAWVQYRDMYGNNLLASGGGRIARAAEDGTRSSSSEAPENDSAQHSPQREMNTEEGDEESTAAGPSHSQPGQGHSETQVVNNSLSAVVRHPYDISMWAP